MHQEGLERRGRILSVKGCSDLYYKPHPPAFHIVSTIFNQLWYTFN